METTHKTGVRPSADQEISLKEILINAKQFLEYMIGRWKIILLAVIIGGGIGFLYSLSRKPLYVAECTFVLEDGTNSGGLGQYAGLASIVGIDIGGSGGGIFEGDNIFELYKSRLMLEKTLLTKVTFNGRPQLLIDRYIAFKDLRTRWMKNPKVGRINFDLRRDRFTLAHDSIVSTVVDDINKNFLTVEKPDKKLSLIQVTVKSPDQLFSKVFAEKIVENVNSFYLQTKTKKSLENISVLQKQADSVRRVLNASISGTASSIDANPNANPALQILRVPSQKRQVDVQANSAIYSEVVKNLEVSKIALRRETPLIQIIDKPILPLKKELLGRKEATLIGALIAALMVVFFIATNRIINAIINS